MTLRPGWLGRQIDAVQKEVAEWPDWMKNPRVRMSGMATQGEHDALSPCEGP